MANPVGANITRLGMFVAAPLVVAGAKWPRAALAAVVSLLLWWQWSPAIDAVARAGHDPSTQASYYAPLLAFLADAGGPAGRVEIPFTRRHYEAAFVAPSVPLARGWERQLDMKVNSLFYEPGQLNAETYRAWLLDTGVRHVALADVALDPSAHAEAALIRAGQPYLRLAWRSLHWTVWEVVGSPGLVSGPAEVVGHDERRHGDAPGARRRERAGPGAGQRVLVRRRPGLHRHRRNRPLGSPGGHRSGAAGAVPRPAGRAGALPGADGGTASNCGSGAARVSCSAGRRLVSCSAGRRLALLHLEVFG